MTRVKVSEATGPVLDWMVAKAEYTDRRVEIHSTSPAVQVENSPGSGDRYGIGWFSFRPSTDWSQGGPIIESIKGLLFKHWLESNREGRYQVEIHNYDGDWIAFGPTLLIAAMRCFVASKLGDEVDVPEELL